MWLDRRFRLGHGKVFALYVMLYTAGRFWIEALRIDTVNEIGGFRLNNYTSLIVFVVGAALVGWLVQNRPGREEVVEGGRPAPAAAAEDDQDPSQDSGASDGVTDSDADRASTQAAMPEPPAGPTSPEQGLPPQPRSPCDRWSAARTRRGAAEPASRISLSGAGREVR